MALDFKVKDIIHKVTAKFVHAFLPTTKKPYNLRAVFQPELDIHGMYPQHRILPKAKRPRQLPQSVIYSAPACFHRIEFAEGETPKQLSQIVTCTVSGIYSPHEILPKAKLPKQLSHIVNRSATACFHCTEFAEVKTPSNNRKS
jgi:hypothetical protein